ncbi:MAG: HAMP domain-containing protein [Gammaproteobacteria bacterium]|nr:HAMP domain-containing protein [Gammaproteobacteria bacterium]
MRLRNKMLFGSAILAVIPVMITVWLLGEKAAEIGEDSLNAQAQDHITSIRDSKKAEIETYFELVTNQLEYFSKLPANLEMMLKFKQAFYNFSVDAAQTAADEDGPPDPDAEPSEGLPIDEYKSALEDYYTGEFTEEFESLNPDTAPNMARNLEALNDNSLALQYHYIAANGNPLGTKEELIAARDPSGYTQLHRDYHPFILDYMNRFGFEDILFVDPDTGYILYSVLKEVDFATSLTDGPYAQLGAAQVYAETLATKQINLIDFAPYLPSYMNQAAFMSAPVSVNNKLIGIFIFRLPIHKINDIMTYDRSWRIDESGKTGETFIVAADGTMRNDSRALVENKEDYIDAVAATGLINAGTIQKIELKDTTVGLQKLDNTGVRAAFSGVVGFDVLPDYRGIDVLSAFSPVNVAGLQWVIFSTLQEDEALEKLEDLSNGINDASVPIGIGVLIGGALIGMLFSLWLAGPIRHLAETVGKVASGDFTARADIKTRDELETLSKAFNGLLDDRLSQLAKAEKENEMLNNSIIELLKASFQLSQRDLTVQVPVTEDVTGPLADAINQMASETSKVLLNVRKISDDVSATSLQVKAQSDNVSKVAEAERAIVATTMTELGAASEAMNKIAEVAQSCNEIALEATRTTQTALETVTSTVHGMGEIRETIHETEKRIKRLGERSQEISGIVDIINNIAERTHVLALNASMQAAAAGEAGRGFSVVADEVQRLAESSRNATSQISALVKNIQVETNDTIATMDKTIEQVVDGSQLAERAGEQMKETQDTTGNLVKVVEQIAMASQQQARISNELREHALSIQSSSEETGRQLEEQSIQTDRLAEYSTQLMESIHVFKLPTA